MYCLAGLYVSCGELVVEDEGSLPLNVEWLASLSEILVADEGIGDDLFKIFSRSMNTKTDWSTAESFHFS